MTQATTAGAASGEGTIQIQPNLTRKEKINLEQDSTSDVAIRAGGVFSLEAVSA